MLEHSSVLSREFLFVVAMADVIAFHACGGRDSGESLVIGLNND
jgi:hypothetical protein